MYVLLAAFVVTTTTTASAGADELSSAWRAARAGSDLIHRVPAIAVLDGAWSVSRQLNTLLVDRGYQAPTVAGLTGHFTRRVLYGTTWTLMLAGESAAVVAALGIDLEWLGAASYRVEWLLPVDLAVCSHIGANAGCGLGTGGVSFLQLRPKGSHWWFEAGGGNTDQRVAFDSLRVVGESTWVLSPVAALREFETPADAPVAARLLAGAGVYFGMRSASMHPSARGADVYPKGRWTELYPIAGGIGPGARVEVALTFARRIVLDANLTVAPFLLNSVADHISEVVAPLDNARSGMPVWRRVDLGIGYRLPLLTMSVVAFASELSVRPLDLAGLRGGLLRFDVPLR